LSQKKSNVFDIKTKEPVMPHGETDKARQRRLSIAAGLLGEARRVLKEEDSNTGFIKGYFLCVLDQEKLNVVFWDNDLMEFWEQAEAAFCDLMEEQLDPE
jgi:hypothetical protein